MNKEIKVGQYWKSKANGITYKVISIDGDRIKDIAMNNVDEYSNIKGIISVISRSYYDNECTIVKGYNTPLWRTLNG